MAATRPNQPRGLAQAERAMSDITMYSRTYCGFCIRARMLLKQRGLAVDEINLDEEPERRPEMIERAGGRSTVPQIFINGNAIGGCDDLFALDASGELDRMLQGGSAASS